jgi:hypothetical protein
VSRTLNLPFDKFPSLGGRLEELSQIYVVWEKAVAPCRYHISPTMNGLRERISPDEVASLPFTSISNSSRGLLIGVAAGPLRLRTLLSSQDGASDAWMWR